MDFANAPTAGARLAHPAVCVLVVDGQLALYERQTVAALMTSGGSRQLAVAARHRTSEHAIRNHKTAIYSELTVRGRLEMHLFAVSHGPAGAGRAEGVS